MSSLHCVVHPLPGTEEQLNERLRELGARINLSGSQGVPSVSDLNLAVRQVVVGPSHIGILTEDGRVGRLVYSVNTDGLDLNKNDQTKGERHFPRRSSSKATGQSSSKMAARMSTSGRRIVRTSSSTSVRGRPSAGVIMGAPPLLPAQYVPDELVCQAQVVLQGKSRNLIIRELQRTNLDVNQAVNNLLSRDDDDVEEQEEADSYAPDDLISLLDANISVASDHPSVIIDAEAMFPEDMFGYSSVRTNRQSSSRRTVDRERESSSSSTPSNSNRQESDSTKKKENIPPEAVDVEHNIHWWVDRHATSPRFVQIASLHSELIALTAGGQVHQWRWADREPYHNPETPNVYHPRAASMGLLTEKVVAISGAIVRCTVATESGKVATWMDEMVAEVAGKLESSAQVYPEMQNEKIQSVHTCHLYTCVLCESGNLFWWGVLPFFQRKKLWEKFKGKLRKPRPEISEGAQVGMRISPMYNPGASAFSMSGGVPKIGQLLNAAWSLGESCRFRIIPSSGNCASATSSSSLANAPGLSHDKRSGSEPPASKMLKVAEPKDSNASDKLDMPPPPSPASSTCSDTGSISSPATYKRGKRTVPKDEERFDEEEWNLKEVVFVEDTRPIPIGEVLAVDGEQVVVVPLKKESKSNLRVYHKNQLQVIKSSGNPRVPDCFQRTPKKVPVSHVGQILTVGVDCKGLAAIVKNGTKISYIGYNLCSSKPVHESSLTTDSGAFIGSNPSAISLVMADEYALVQAESIGVLRDGNSTLYPMSKDCVSTFKDPLWPDLPPVSCVGMGVHFLHSAGPHQKSHVAVVVLATQKQLLMPKILKCDLEGVKRVLAMFDSNSDQEAVNSVLNEKVDGNHNILHACVSACTPIASKEPENESSYETKEVRLSGSSPWMESHDVMSVVGNIEDNLMGPSSSKAGPSMPCLTPCDPQERRSVLLHLVKTINENPLMKPSLKGLLSARDSSGMTPFMLAVSGRAYQAALLLLDIITHLASEMAMDSEGERRVMAQMIFPRGSNPDDSPLHVLCYNDTCSFTWTGDQHINQDIFECRTCGLTGSLCCCTECARVCHKGHDCKLKHTSPTAYCDCWQKCKCRALKAGHQGARFDLLSRLATETDLVNHPNGRGENILLFLLQTVRRQVREQKQYPSRFRSCMNSRNKNNANDSEMEMPEHNLDPPKFSRKALERLLKDWNAVKAMVLTGSKDEIPSNANPSETSSFMQLQGHTTHLDKFTYSLLVKLSVFHCDDKVIKNKHLSSTDEDERKAIADTAVSTLISTFQRELHNEAIPGRREEAIKVARRFVASAVRIFVILGIEASPISNKKKNQQYPSPFAKCVKVFESLLPMAVCELCEAADALLMPVRLNFVKPTAPFPLTNVHVEGIIGCQEMFEVEPIQSQGSRASNRDGDAGQVSSEDDHVGSRFSSSGVPRQLGRHRDSSVAAQSDDQDNDASSEREEVQERSENEGGNEAGESDLELDLLASDSDSDDNQSAGGADNVSTQRSVQTGATAGSDAEDDSPDSSGAEDDDDQSEAAETDEIDSAELFSDEQLERRGNASITSRNAAPYNLEWAIRSIRENSRSGPGQSSGLSSPGIYIDPPTLRRPAGGSVPSVQEPLSLNTTNNTLARAFAIIIRQISQLMGMACQATKSGERPATLSGQNITPELVVTLLRHLDSRLQPSWTWILNVMDTTEAQLRFGRELHQIIEGSTGSGSSSSGSGSQGPSSSGGGMSSSHGSSVSGSTALQSNMANMRARDLSSSNRSGQSVPQSSSGNPPLTSSSNRVNLGLIGDPILHGRSSSSRRNARAMNTVTESHSARRDTLSYVVSLLRAHKNEHCDSLPDIDVGSLKHVAYAFDALMCYLRSCGSRASSLDQPSGLFSSNKSHAYVLDTDENDNEDEMDDTPPVPPVVAETESMDEDSNPSVTLNRNKRHSFFQRSNSTLCLGSAGVDVFAKPLQEALPLADKPHLLQPDARKEELFGFPKSLCHNTAGGRGAPLDTPLSRLGLIDNQQKGPSYIPPTKDGFYIHLFNCTDYLQPQQQQPTDLSTSSFGGSSALPIFKGDAYSYERVPIIMAPRRPLSGPYDSYPGDAAARLGVKSVIVRVGASPTSVPPPPPYSSSPPGGSGYKGEASSPKPSNSEASSSSPQENPTDLREQMRPALLRNGVTQDMLLGRWRLTVELYGRVFTEDVGAEPGSSIALLGDFPVKEHKFRREMEKLRNGQQKDLLISKVERDRGHLISHTFRELNNHFNNNNINRRNNNTNPPLVVHRVKVTFKDEPGEGSGVARSFYTAISEALLSQEKLPGLESCQVGLSVVRFSLYGQYKGRDRDRRQSASGKSPQKKDSLKKSLSIDARPFYSGGDPSSEEQLPPNLQEVGDNLFPKVQLMKPTFASKITGMLLELSHPQLIILSSSDSALRNKVEEAADMIMSYSSNSTPTSPQNPEDPMDDQDEVVAPLFYQPGKTGFYSPRQAKATAERMNAFRNVGRLMGLCLLQNELCPIYLNRHVLKFILGRTIRFHDLAFFDPVVYETMRKMVHDTETKENGPAELRSLELTFSIDCTPEEGGGPVELIPGGKSFPVTPSNVYDYVQKYATHRMVKSQMKALQNIRDGVFDVIPVSSLAGLTSEDLRLLLNGIGDINVSTLISYTTFNDESTSTGNLLQPFKRWLWSIVEKMTTQERQDLVYFWTGSPALPSSEEGFQPIPSVTIRPPDDSHLPTANTCISRLYIPLYSSRAILRSKLLLAIKTKNFGFV